MVTLANADTLTAAGERRVAFMKVRARSTRDIGTTVIAPDEHARCRLLQAVLPDAPSVDKDCVTDHPEKVVTSG